MASSPPSLPSPPSDDGDTDNKPAHAGVVALSARTPTGSAGEPPATPTVIRGRHATLSGIRPADDRSGAVSYTEGGSFDTVSLGPGSVPVEFNSVLLVPDLLSPTPASLCPSPLAFVAEGITWRVHAAPLTYYALWMPLRPYAAAPGSNSCSHGLSSARIAGVVECDWLIEDVEWHHAGHDLEVRHGRSSHFHASPVCFCAESHG
jgi:hypothetical protein